MAANLDLGKISGEIENIFPNEITEDDRSRLRKFKDWVLQRRSEVKPWGDFFNTRKFSRPKNVSEASGRIINNIKLFQANYFVVCVLMAFYCILTSPLLLFGLSLSIGGCYFISTRGQGQPIRLFGKEFTKFQQYGLVFLISLPLFFLASAGSTVFWIIGASIVVIGIHASLLASQTQSTELEMESISIN